MPSIVIEAGLQDIRRETSANFIDGDTAHFCQAEAIWQVETTSLEECLEVSADELNVLEPKLFYRKGKNLAMTSPRKLGHEPKLPNNQRQDCSLLSSD